MTLLTVDEAARFLRVKASWIYERTRTNEIPHIKLGKYLRFEEEELQAWFRRWRRDGRGGLEVRAPRTSSEPKTGFREPAIGGRKTQRSVTPIKRFQ